MPLEGITWDAIWTRYTAHDTTTDMTYVEEQNLAGWDNNLGYAQLLKYDTAGNLVWQVGSYGAYGANNTQPAPGCIDAVRNFLGRTHNCSVLLDFNGGWNNANYPITYVYDDDGLWVGSLFDNVNPLQNMKDFWLVSDNATGDLYTDPVTGAVTYFGTGENQIYAYNITGWDNWERHSGCVTAQSVATPTFTPAPGTYSTNPQAVTLACATSGATIRYTTDGTTPSETVGTIYSSALSLSASATLNAIAYETGLTDSTVASGIYTMSPLPSGAVLWLKADTGVTADGNGNVSTWADQSGAGYNVTQSTGTLQPQLVNNAIGNLPAINFTGSDALENTQANLVAAGSARTVLAVAQASATGDGGALLTFRRSRQSPPSNARIGLMATFIFIRMVWRTTRPSRMP